MAPAVANPYTNTARGTAADTGGVVGGAVGALVAPRDGTPGTAGAAAAGDDAPADGDVQGAHGHSTPRTFTEEELRDTDPRLQRLTAADRQLLGIFGDRIHLNDGTHLDGGIGVNECAGKPSSCQAFGQLPFQTFSCQAVFLSTAEPFGGPAVTH